MKLAGVKLVQAIREALSIPLMYPVREDKIDNIKDPKEKEEVEQTIKQCQRALMQQVNQLVRQLDPLIEPPDITNPIEISNFIEKISRKNIL